MQTSTAPQTNSQASKETSSASAPSSQTSEPTTPIKRINHAHAADLLERDIKHLDDILVTPITVGQSRLWFSIKSNLENLASWHRQKADEIQRHENLFSLSEINKFTNQK